MNEHWVRSEEAYSNVAVARACEVTERTVRQWRQGEKRLPPEAIPLLPGQLFDEVIAIITSLRTRAPKRAITMLRQALTDLPGQLAGEDSHEVVRALIGAQGQISDLMKKAMGDR